MLRHVPGLTASPGTRYILSTPEQVVSLSGVPLQNPRKVTSEDAHLRRGCCRAMQYLYMLGRSKPAGLQDDAQHLCCEPSVSIQLADRMHSKRDSPFD